MAVMALVSKRIITLIVTVLIAGPMAIKISPAADKSKTAQTQALTQLTVIEHAITDFQVDAGEPGNSLGDLVASANELFDETDTTKIGEDRGHCILVEVNVTYHCTATMLLQEGSIAIAGPFFVDGRPNVLAITGGTGAYAGAKGEMTSSFRDSDAGFNKHNFVFKFSP
jgi:allene oxide cyclase